MSQKEKVEDEKEAKMIEMVVIHQGAPKVNHAYIEKGYEDMIAVGVDLRSKYCVVDAIGGDEECPEIFIGTTNESIDLNGNVDRNEPTLIKFPSLSGYRIWCDSISRYTLRICFIKKSKYD